MIDVVVVVLDVGESGLNVLLVVVVNQGDGAGDVAVPVVLAVFDKLAPNHVGHSQGAVVVALFTGHPVKLFGQRLRDRDREPDDTVGFSGFHSGDLNRGAGIVNGARHRVREF